MFPSLELLAHATALHSDTVGRALVDAAKQAFVIRTPRFGETLADARAHGWLYAAAVPTGWLDANPLRTWEQDDRYRSERSRRRRLRKAVPTVDRDKKPPVPIVDRSCPDPASVVSRSSVVSVPVQSRKTSSMISSITNSVISHTDAQKALARKRDQQRSPEEREQERQRQLTALRAKGVAI